MTVKTVLVNFTDNSQKPYTDVPAKVLANRDAAGRLIVSRARKDYPEKNVETWEVEEEKSNLVPVLDTEIASTLAFPLSFKLTSAPKSFTLKDVVKSSLRAQRGLTEQQIVQNLRNLATTCLDPIKKKFPSMRITSGFRLTGEVAGESKTTDHGLGAAVDLSFTVKNGTEEWVSIVTWIKNNIPFKQLLLEFEEKYEKEVYVRTAIWIHLAYVQVDGKVIKSALPFGTFWNRSVADNGRLTFVALA
jgi:hypothetical protein